MSNNFIYRKYRIELEDIIRRRDSRVKDVDDFLADHGLSGTSGLRLFRYVENRIKQYIEQCSKFVVYTNNVQNRATQPAKGRVRDS